MVLGDSQEPEPQGSKRPKKRKETSTRRKGKRVEPGNLSDKDIGRLVS
jgi:putative transposase